MLGKRGRGLTPHPCPTPRDYYRLANRLTNYAAQRSKEPPISQQNYYDITRIS